ncbi:YARHG domain-containing protein [Agathobaculum sp.]|uniref:YARHG domain-containing protein n=1 Tax=Agathobaculum sp. TaxID=2048138 RepID=UPI002A80F902|nr:YARHG domain-containing protein [Agathobaculum sp.]MDY3617782.1 YARHG domain-containing protein [Agathobaculum sp.]
MFCKFCGAQLPNGSLFCTTCGKNLTPEQDAPVQKDTVSHAAAPQQAPDHSEPPLMAQQVCTPKKRSTGKIIAVVAAALAVAGLVIGGVIAVNNQRKHEQELQAAQAQAAEAQQAAEQAQQQAEAAQAEREQAQKDAEQAQKDAETAKQEADKAKADASAQAALILAAITAARDGDSISFDGYIFPSDRQYITEADMLFWDLTIALLARNEIFARHGYVFETDYIQNYFSAQSWYWPDSSYKGGNLNKVEQANVDTILAYEKKRGWQ